MDDDYRDMKELIDKWSFITWRNKKQAEKNERQIQLIKDYLKVINRRMNTLRLAIDQLSEISRN
jgi:hypothetical protein